MILLVLILALSLVCSALLYTEQVGPTAIPGLVLFIFTIYGLSRLSHKQEMGRVPTPAWPLFALECMV